MLRGSQRRGRSRQSVLLAQISQGSLRDHSGSSPVRTQCQHLQMSDQRKEILGRNHSQYTGAGMETERVARAKTWQSANENAWRVLELSKKGEHESKSDHKIKRFKEKEFFCSLEVIFLKMSTKWAAENGKRGQKLTSWSTWIPCITKKEQALN